MYQDKLFKKPMVQQLPKEYSSKQQVAPLPVFFIYGELAPMGYLNGEDPITEKYGFKLKRIAGCEISNTIIKKAYTQNQKSFKEMNTKYGKYWIDEFEKKSKYKLAIPSII